MIPNRSILNASVIPELAYPDVTEAAEWLCSAFGFKERLRIGNHRVRQYNAEDPGGHRWTFSESIEDIDPTSWGGTPVNLE